MPDSERTMLKLDAPLQISPVFKPKIWGRLDLGPIFETDETTPRGQIRPRPSTHRPPAGTKIGEVWVTDAESRFMNGPLAGMTLAEAVRTYGPALCGRKWNESRFPILAKYLFTKDWLSVQVHPDDEQARLHDPGNTGKTEMWYVIGRGKGAEILLGLNHGASAEALRAASAEGKGKDLLHGFHPHVGEAIFVPPGTVHTLGPELTLFEVEQNSDLTYRLDDFGRRGLDGKPRPLHWEKALGVIQSGRKPVRNLPLLKFREPYGDHRYVLACRHFAVEELTIKRLAHLAGHLERVEILSILEGEGRFETDAGWLGAKLGQTWLIPPATRAYRLVRHEDMRLLKYYVPDVEADFRAPLRRRGIPAAEISRVVFD